MNRAIFFRSNWPAVFFGLILFLGLFASSEAVFYFLNQHGFSYDNNYKVLHPIAGQPDGLAERHFAVPTSLHLREKNPSQNPWPEHRQELLDYSKKVTADFWLPRGGMRPGRSRSLVTIADSGEVIYDVEISIDSLGWRETPQIKNLVDKHLILLGCSWVFGEGVNDGETLASFVAKAAQGYRVYNRGEPASSPNQILHHMWSGRAWAGVEESSGAAAYLYGDFHLPRSLGVMSSVGSHWMNAPYVFEDDQGQILGDGTFKSAWPWRSRIYKFFWSLQIVKYFKIDWPLEVGPKQVEFFAKLILEMKKEYLKKFPGQEFYVVFYPDASFGAAHIIPYLEKYGVRYLDYRNSSLTQYTTQPVFFKYDGHPTREANRIFGEHLVADLGVAPAYASGP